MTDPTPAGEPLETQTRTPRWVIVFAIIGGLLVLVFLVLHLMGRGMGSHGP